MHKMTPSDRTRAPGSGSNRMESVKRTETRRAARALKAANRHGVAPYNSVDQSADYWGRLFRLDGGRP